MTLRADRFARVAAVIAAIASLVVVPAKAADPIKVGAPFIFSGPGAFTGESSKLALEMLGEETNAAGGIGGRPIQFIYYDTEGKPDVAVRVINRLVKSDHVDAVLGPIASWEVAAVKQVLERAGTPTLLLASARTFVDPPSKCIFKLPTDDKIVVGRIYEYLRAAGLTKVAVVSGDDGYGDGGQRELKAQAKSNGIEIVFDEKFSMDDTDLAPLLNKIKRTDAQVVINWSSSRAPIVLTNAYRQVGLTQPLLHGPGALSDAVLKGTGANAEGMLSAGPKFEASEELPDADPQKAPLLRFREAYKKKYNKDANQFNGGAYDAFQILKIALQKSGTDPIKLCTAIAETRNYVGVGGVYNYSDTDHAGLTADAVVVYKVRAGKWRLVR